MASIEQVLMVLLVIASGVYPVHGLPFTRFTEINISGVSSDVTDYQISYKVNLSKTKYPVFTYATVDEPHYNNIFETCFLPGDYDTIWVKIPAITKNGTTIREWYNPVYPVSINQDCRNVFLFYDEFETEYINYVAVRRIRP